MQFSPLPNNEDPQGRPNSIDQSSLNAEDGAPDSALFVTEPALGLRPDLIKDYNENIPQYDEYDAERCEVT